MAAKQASNRTAVGEPDPNPDLRETTHGSTLYDPNHTIVWLDEADADETECKCRGRNTGRRIFSIAGRSRKLSCFEDSGQAVDDGIWIEPC
jgi:hypothetical protein